MVAAWRRKWLKKAWWLTETGPTLRSYSTAEADEASEEALSFGLGCNGKVHVLFERLPASGPCALVDALLSVRDTHQPAAIATVIASPAGVSPRLGERLFLVPGQRAAGELRHSVLAEQISSDLQQTLVRGKSSRCLYPNGSDEMDVLLEYIPPVLRLVIFGAGHDAQPLVRMAKLLGWHVTVIDGRRTSPESSALPTLIRCWLAMSNSLSPTANMCVGRGGGDDP